MAGSPSPKHEDEDEEDFQPKFLSRINTFIDPGDAYAFALISPTSNAIELNDSKPLRFPSLRTRIGTNARRFPSFRGKQSLQRAQTYQAPLQAVPEAASSEDDSDSDNEDLSDFERNDESSAAEHALDAVETAKPVLHKSQTVRSSIASTEQVWSVFSQRTKVTIIVVATIAGCFNPFTQNIFYPSVGTISEDLKISITQVNLTVTAYILCAAFAPMIIAAIADARGRRPAYILGFGIFLLSNIGLALNNTFPGLLLLRCVQSCGSSGLGVLRSGTISDVATRAEIGKYVAITSISAIVAPSIGPICGGLLAGKYGWHAIFWFLFALSTLFFIPLVLFFPETCRAVVGDGSIPPPKWNRSLGDVTRRHTKDIEQASQSATVAPVAKSPRRKVDLLGAFTLMADPETALILLFIGIINLGISAQATSLTTQFASVYNLTVSQQGLLFLPQAAGSIIAALTNSKLLDLNFRRHALKAGLSIDKKKQSDLSSMNIEKARLEIAFPSFLLAGFLLFCYGWALAWKVKIVGPIMFLTLFSVVIGIGFGTLSVLIADMYQDKAATASASATFAKAAFAAAGSAFVEPVLMKIGVGWTFTICGGLYLVILPLMYFVMRNGPEMRRGRVQKQNVTEKERRTEQTVTENGLKTENTIRRMQNWFENLKYRVLPQTTFSKLESNPQTV